MFEVGEDQASSVKDLMRMAGLHDDSSVLSTHAASSAL